MQANDKNIVKTGSWRGRYGASEGARILLLFIVPALLAAALIGMGAWGRRQQLIAEELRTANEGYYRRDYRELTDSVGELRGALSKLLVSETPRTIAMTLDDIWRGSGEIASLMGRIPQPHPDSIELNRFLIQVGDYCRRLTQSVLGGTDRKSVV